MDRDLLQTKLVKFGVMVMDLTNSFTYSSAGRNMANQLVRSGSSPALNYAESKSAESTRDFVHKLTIVLKELRETAVCLKMVEEIKLCDNLELLSKLRSECDQLEAIFVSSIKTVKTNLRSEVSNLGSMI